MFGRRTLPVARVLFTVVLDGGGSNLDDTEIAVQPLDSTDHKIMFRGGTFPRYVPRHI
jgi:hypothetical protein